MRHTTLLLALLFFCGTSNAQVTITQNDMPHAGDALVRTRAFPNPLLNYTNTGPNSTWNYTNLTALGQDTRDHATVGSTSIVYSVVYADIFLNPNRANHVTEGVDIPFYELLPIENPYTFYFRSSSVYRKVGYGAEVAGIPLPITMDQQDVIYQLPLNFGNTSTSNSAYDVDVPELAYYGYRQVRNNVVDGWGTVNTPAGSFNALRVKTTIAGRDTIQVDLLSLGFAIERPVITEYKWLSPGFRVPVLQINTVNILGVEAITEVFFFDEERSLTVDQPLALELCPGQSLPVDYTSTGVFNPGAFLVAGNQFRVQLSDANGSFAAPVAIGSVTATTSGTINATIPANTPAGSGYRIRLVSTNPAFTGPDNGADITIGATPQAQAQADGPATFCEGGSVVLNAAADPAYSYQWQVDGVALVGANGPSVEASTSGNYQVVVTTACGSATSEAIAVAVDPLPTHALVPPDNLFTCAGEPVTFGSTDLSGLDGLAYQWLLNGDPIDGAVQAEWSTAVAGAYALQVTDPQTSCVFTTAEAELVVEEVPAPVVLAEGPTTFCAGGDVLLQADAQPGSTYQWSLDGASLAGTDGAELTATEPGAYTVVAISENGCPSPASESVVVAVNPLPAVPTVVASAPTTLCAGDELTLLATGDADVAWQWTLAGEPIPGADQPELTVSATGAYSVIATNAFGCQAAAAEAVDVLVETLPVAPAVVAADEVTFCAGSAVTLVATAAPGLTITWSVDGVAIPGATGAQYQAGEAGTYTAVAVSTAGCSSATSNAVVVEVLPAPPAPVALADGPTTFCAGGQVALNASGAPGSAFSWSLDGAAIQGAGGSGYVALASGAYTVVAIDASGCVSEPSAPVVVEVVPLPAAPVVTALDPTTFCAGGTAVLEAAAEDGTTLQWSLNGEAIAGADQAQLEVATAGAYSVTATNVTGCVSAGSWPAIINVLPVPAAPALSASGATSFCDGGEVTLSAQAEPGTALQWSVDGLAIDGATGSDLLVTTTGGYSVTATDANGCSATSAIATVLVNPVPAPVSLNATTPTTVCEGGSVTLVAGIAPGISYTWYVDGELLEGVSSQTYAASVGGSYTVVAISGDNCVAGPSEAITVTVEPAPDAPQITLTESPEFCEGSSTTLVAVAAGGVQYQWTLNGQPVAGAVQAQYTVSSAGQYSLVITDANGCSAEALAGVTVTVNALPPAPVISQEVDVLSASGNGPFQWFLNGEPVAGATSAQLTVTENGVYTVSTTSAEGCVAESDPFTVSNVGVDELTSAAFTVFPNPSNGQFNLRMAVAPRQGAYYTVHDATGRLVKQGGLVQLLTVIDLPDALTGMYFLQVVNGEVGATQRLMVTR